MNTKFFILLFIFFVFGIFKCGSDAEWIELMSGADFSGWREDTGDWQIVGKTFMNPDDEKLITTKPGSGIFVNGATGKTVDLFTELEHGDVEMHIEFMVPKDSNSGIYFQGRYEIQVLDSWGVNEPKFSDCGGIYQRWDNGRGYGGVGPRVNASRQPGRWQSFDVVFKAPRFDDYGRKISDAVFVKVVHNGKVIHENVNCSGPTRASAFKDEKPKGPLMFQGDHGPVAYRNMKVHIMN